MGSREITLKRILEHEPCDSQALLFHRIFGKRAYVTQKGCKKVAPLFDWYWAASHLLTYRQRKMYRRADRRAVAEYNRIREEAWQKWDYGRWIIPPKDWEKLRRARRRARLQYEVARAVNFAKAYNSKRR